MAFAHLRVGSVSRELTLSNARRMLPCGGDTNPFSASLNETAFLYHLPEHICLATYLKLLLLSFSSEFSEASTIDHTSKTLLFISKLPVLS